MKKSCYEGVYTDGRNYYTRTIHGESVYGEKVIHEGKWFYRLWNPKRSKLSAAMHLNLKNFPFKDSRVLYLGAATGTTVSHVSDLARLVWGVEISPISMRGLVHLAEKRENIIPILEDARYPEKYTMFVDKPDVIYQDVSQRDQVRIFIKNMDFYSPRYGFLMLKTRTIDMRKKPKEVMRESVKIIGERFKISEIINISRFQRDHYAIVVIP